MRGRMRWGCDVSEADGEGMLMSSSKKALIRLGVGDEREGVKTEEGRPRDAATGARTWRVI
jgi:hypothetical protein